MQQWPYDRTASELIKSLKKHPDDIGATIGDWKPDAGAWIRFNPVDGEGVKNENVTRFTYALVESDTLPVAEQDILFRKLELPVAALVHSGGKSLHAIVRVDAENYEEYRNRVEFLYDFLDKHGVSIDKQNRNPSRLSRMPGVTRSGNRQYLVATNIGRKSWVEWMDFVEGVSDELPDMVQLSQYARVSTDMEDQQTSYEAQCDYYTQYIQSRDDWEFVGLYSDEGITACNTFKRDGFNRMIEDALSGKIDLIITKSVSRFARNTVDSLSTIRKLKEHGTECYFEKENIWTFDSKGELLITIMSSLAQEESRSISENCTWGWRKRCADGKVTVPFGRFLGYDRGEDGNLVVNEEQAEIVRRIYGLFLQGRSPYQIAKLLTNEGIPTPGGKTNWCGATVESILTNEKYKGDALLQKVYTITKVSYAAEPRGMYPSSNQNRRSQLCRHR